MKAEIEKQVDGTMKVTISCTAVELEVLGESLQQAIDERAQRFGTHVLKVAQKHLSK